MEERGCVEGYVNIGGLFGIEWDFGWERMRMSDGLAGNIMIERRGMEKKLVEWLC